MANKITCEFSKNHLSLIRRVVHHYNSYNGTVTVEEHKELEGISKYIDTLHGQNINTDWFADYKSAFGMPGLVVLAYWIGCALADDIREQHKGFPFLCFTCESGDHRSALLTFLWKLFGNEQFEPLHPAGMTSHSIQNWCALADHKPVVFSDKKMQYRWDDLLSLFNGELPKFIGTRNDHFCKKFKGGLVIAQKRPLELSNEVKRRTIFVDIQLADDAALQRLVDFNIDEAYGVICAVNGRRDELIALFNDVFLKFCQRLMQDSRWKSFGIIEALVHCLALIFGLSHGELSELIEFFRQSRGSLSNNKEEV